MGSLKHIDPGNDTFNHMICMVCAPFHNIKEADILNEKAPEHCIAFHFQGPSQSIKVNLYLLYSLLFC